MIIPINNIKDKVMWQIIPLIIAFVQWGITNIFEVDRFFFTYDEHTHSYYIVKFLYFIFLFLLWKYIFFVILNLKSNIKLQRWFGIFVFYFFIMLILLLVLWPGTWCWDDIWVANKYQYYIAYGWHHVITEYLQMVLLQILPFVGGVVLLQNLIISSIVAYIILEVETNFLDGFKYKNPLIDLLIKCFPFLLPPIVLYQMSGYRMGVYVYFEILLVCMLICLSRASAAKSYKWIAVVAVLTALVSNWRNESIFYVFLTPLLFITAPCAIISNKKKILGIIIVLFSFLLIRNEENSTLQAMGYGSNYEVTSTLLPGVEAIRAADSSDGKLLEVIGRVLKLDIIYKNPDLNGEELYWLDEKVVKAGYSETEYHDYMKAIIELAIKHYDVVVKERVKNALSMMGVYGKQGYVSTNIIDVAAKLFDEEEIGPNKIFQNENWLFNKPISAYVRKNVILLLGFSRSDGTTYRPYFLFWNSLLPSLFMFFTCCCLFVKKAWKEFMVYCFALVKIPIICITAPSTFFFYMLSAYMLGWASLTLCFLILASNKK